MDHPRLDVLSILLGALVAFGFWVFLERKKKHLPKHFKHFKVQTVKHQDDNTRDAYKQYKVPEDIDAIVIGSGIGGMMCAGLLARVGKKVVVLEQHYVAGGCTHAFEDHGYEFDTGVHYIGRAEQFGKLISKICGPKKINWVKMGTPEDGHVYDEIRLGDKKDDSFLFKAGLDKYIESLVAAFPEEEAAIRKYVKLVKECSSGSALHFFGKLLPHWLYRVVDAVLLRKYNSMANKSLQEVLDSLTSNKRLQAVLSGQFGDYGLLPPKSSFYVHSGLVTHYFYGGYYPAGGTQEITRCIIPMIEAAGGRVFVRARVDKILVWPESGPNRSAYGVRMADGDEIRAKCVISGAGVPNTYQKLLGDSFSIPKPLGGRFLNNSVSHLYLFVGLKGSSEELDLKSRNIWYLPCDHKDYDVSTLVNEYYTRGLEMVQEAHDPASLVDKMFMFVGSPSAKDPTYNSRFPGKSNVIIITEAKYEWFEKYGGTETGKRDPEYTALKQKFQNILLEGLYKFYPQCRGKVDYVELATPLTNVFYLDTPQGSSYGLEHSPDRYSHCGGYGPYTEVDNLYLTGQDIAVNGFAGAAIGGVITAHAVLGYNSVDLLVKGRNLMKEIMELPELDFPGPK
eukprot:TRINITY_DN1565_c0_g1::TRINITY_DN1565_c0_g1_i1::g.28112::m.28112 TRINITY_DN1565_c0_g1::TRINITY_DN1565_c0_g1_i1::g.28112  ORF type:complete len:622 (+),score=202.41,sp/Q5BLE8/RETST_DANRE/38.16/1e-113,NAD_binding_8/PF13450.1/5.1e-12,DAO/PF01266.19/2e-05,DAO/PF01266.19/0.012,FAD_binding_2/PF00890.19/9e-07,Amino_oxidase/PF01593.19/0.00027,Amino_oxidase/PF01593.19/6.1e+02,Thi4/PF01946.12/0.00032,HI0933_like/PF03486.9/0.0063,HI0933_like/PF03486.9/1.7e+03,HI0933_like/PF03486.9/9.8e+02,FAD_binding_3/PF01